MLGARASTSGTAFSLSGVLRRAHLLTDKAVPEHVAVDFGSRGTFVRPTGDVFDLLAAQDRALFLSGVQGFTVAEHSFSVASAFSIGAVVRIVPRRSGYLFAKATSSGSRYYSLYVSNTNRRVSMYYASGASGLRRIDFGVALADGRVYHILLAVNGTSALLFVDDVQIGDAKTLASPIQDCGARSSDCHLTIGERPSLTGGAHRLAALFFDVQLINGQALTTYPHYSRRPI